MSFVKFISSPLGIICVSVLSSLVGTSIYNHGEKIIHRAGVRYKRKRLIKWLVRSGETYSNGYITAYAQNKSSFHQLLLIGDYIIKIIIEIARILGIVLITIILILLTLKYIVAGPILVAISSIFISFYFQKLKRLIRAYRMMYDYVYGDEYKKHLMEGVHRYWNDITGNNKDVINTNR